MSERWNAELTGRSRAARPRVLAARLDLGLVGRTDCLRVLNGVLDDALRGEGRALVVRGPAGIGKSALLAGMVARANGMLVLRAQGKESESQMAYSGLFDLCRPILDQFDRLPAAQSAALRSALALAPPSGQDQLAAAVALLDLLALVAAETPVLVLVDDGQWLDTATSATLSFVARRLRHVPVAVILAVRDGAGDDVRYEGLEDLLLAGLSSADSAQLLSQHARTELAEAVARKVAAVSEGNPLALIELAGILTPEQLSGRAPLPDQLPVGSRLAAVFDSRVSALPPGTARSTGIVALWEGGISALVDGRVAGFNPADLRAAADAGLLTVSQDRVAFRHPLARAAAVRAMGSTEFRGAHRAMADLVEDDHELRAWHLAAAAEELDEVAATALVDAAAVAAGRGALTTAADMFERAAELTPDREVRGARLVEAGGLSAQSGETQRAIDLCHRARDCVSDPISRARVEHLWGRLATSGTMSVPKAIALLEGEFSRVGPLDAELAVRIGVDACLLAVQAGNQALAVDLAQRAHEAAQRGDVPARALAQFALESARGFAADSIDAQALVDSHERLLGDYPIFADLRTVTAVAVVGLSAREMYGLARVIADRFVVAARARGAIGSLPLVLALGAKAALLMDEWESAEKASEEALHLAQDAGQSWGAQYAAAWLAVLGALRGREDVVQAWSADVVGWSGMIGTTPGHAIICHALGLLALGHGRTEEAVVHLDAVARLRLAQKASSDGLLHWEGDYAEALIRTGRAADAVGQLARLEDRVAGSSNPWARVVSARCRGLLVDPADVDTAFAKAFDADPQLTLPFERLRTEWCWGERLLSLGRHSAATAHLRLALVGFEGFGAVSWASRTRAALQSAGTGHAISRTERMAPAEDDWPHPTAAGAPETAYPILVTMGDFMVKTGGEEVRLFGHVGRAVAFIAARGSAVHVDELIEALWPDAPPDVGRARLRNVLSRSRLATGAVLVRDGEVIRVADGVRVDLVVFESLAAAALRRASAGDPSAADIARSALAHHRGEFAISNRYDDWIVPVRERVERRRVALLDLLAIDAEHRGDIDEMIAYLELAIHTEPENEQRYLRGARSLASLGRQGAALRLVERAQQIGASLHLRPGAELAALRTQLLE
jgi:DNA-binding SARP family transcriptional activator